MINLQRDGSQAKPYQVRQVRRTILRRRKVTDAQVRGDSLLEQRRRRVRR